MIYKMYCFRISDEMKDQLKKEAEQKGMTLNSYLNLIIAERLK